jgi:L-lactate dehydrogenase complex protein LldG
MKNNASRDKILSKIRQSNRKHNLALSTDFSTFNNDEIFFRPDNLIETFKKELETINGKCFVSSSEYELVAQLKNYLQSLQLQIVFCRDKLIDEFLNKHTIAHTAIKADFETMQVGITLAEVLVARTGSVIISSGGDSGRQMNVFPLVHIILADASQIVNYPEEALIHLRKKYGEDLPSLITFITGPSRTADIEKTLVLGAHGPKELAVFVRLQ